MADEAEDVLDLEEDQVLEDDELDREDEDDEAGEDGTSDEDDDPSEPEEPFIGFEGDEAAPASEGDSSVIRELRKANREQQKRIAELERGQAPVAIEVGEKPTLESCEYDEDRFEKEITAYHDRKAKAEQQDAEAKKRKEAEAKQWEGRVAAFEADKAKLGVSDFDDAEAEVQAALPPTHLAVLLRTKKPAALVYALARSPARLKELSELEPLEAAMALGKLEDKLKMGTRKAPQPDRPVRGNAAPANADKELARLEKEAERTGNRSKVIAYRKKLNSKA